MKVSSNPLQERVFDFQFFREITLLKCVRKHLTQKGAFLADGIVRGRVGNTPFHRIIFPVNEVILKILLSNRIYLRIPLLIDKEFIGVIPNSID